ncbi:hypothetical protein ZWY2020_044683 [Hordeum vulgare]|nr:hypothetical protein ZWY2020_044683 [Hordeum vulgare]
MAAADDALARSNRRLRGTQLAAGGTTAGRGAAMAERGSARMALAPEDARRQSLKKMNPATSSSCGCSCGTPWCAAPCRASSGRPSRALLSLPGAHFLLRHPRPEGGGCLHAFGPDHHCWLRLPFTSFLPHQAFSPVASSGSLLYLWIETGPPPAPIPSSSSSTSSPQPAQPTRPRRSPSATRWRAPTACSLRHGQHCPEIFFRRRRRRRRRGHGRIRNTLVAELDTMQKLADGCNIQVPMEVVNLIDDGKNPDEFTRDVLNSCIAKNQITKGKTDAFKSLRKHLLEELEEAFPDDVEAYRQIRATSATESKRLAQSQSALPNGDASET